MSDKEEESENDSDSQENSSTKLTRGNLLAFGSLNLTFTLILNKQDLKKYKIKFDSLKTLEDLKFITNHKSFIKRVELSSKSDVMNILLIMNKSAKKILKIGYVSYKKIVFKEEQENFKNFVEKVTKLNGIYLTSSGVCNCSMGIDLILRYENKEKKFIICGEGTTDAIKEEKEEINSGESDDDKNKSANNKKKVGSIVKKAKENKYEENNPFVNITKDIVKLGEYKYIYFNYNDYINGEFSNTINILNVYEYFQNIKLVSKSKIILNLENFDIDIDNMNITRDLLALTDIFIFYNKNKLYEVLKVMKEEEDNENTEKLHKYYYLEIARKTMEKEEFQQIEEEKVKKYKLFLEKEKEKEKRFKKLFNLDKRSNTEQNESYYNKSKIYLTQEDNDKNKESEISEINKMISTTTDDGGSPNKKKFQVNYRKKNLYLKLSQPQTLNKNQIWEYFKHGIYDKDPQKKGEKIIIAMDEFKKILFVKYTKKSEKPYILEYDLKLHPQINLRNMKEILDFKNLIKSKFDEYINIYIGTLLGIVLKKNNIEDNDFLLGYLYATNKLKKLAEIQRYNLPIPKEKNFFYPNLSKKAIEQMLKQTTYNKKEKLFVLDGNKKKTIGIKQYNPLLDKNLASFLNSRNNQNFLKLNGFINQAGEIMYDPIYRDTLKDKKNATIEESTMYKSFQTTNKFLSGYKRKIPEYSIYHPNKNYLVLPPIQKKKSNTVDKKKDTIDEADDESGNNSGSRNEEDDSGSGGGDSGSDEQENNNNDRESNKESNKNSGN